MQADPNHYIQSVSDLYGTDEIDVLLEEIRDLEPASCRAEDVQDFEIAGSRTGVAHLESPAVTVRSWDSHANYRHHTGSSPTGSLFSGVILYCDETHFRSSTGLLRVLLVVSSIACLACLCSSGTVKVGLFMLPLAGRIRLMMFVTIFSLLVTCLFLFLDISHIVYLFPFNWGKVNAILYVGISVLYLVASSLVVHMIHADTFYWVPKWSKDQLLVTGILGYVCSLEGIFLTLFTRCDHVQYSPVDEDPSQMVLQETAQQSQQDHKQQLQPNNQQQQHQQTTSRRHNQPPAVQQQRRAPPKPAAAPSSTKSTPANSWPIDDVQPCSSKSVDPYTMA